MSSVDQVDEGVSLTDLAYRRAREVLETAVADSQRLRAEATEEARQTREQALASLVESLRVLKQSAEAETASMLEEARKEVARLNELTPSDPIAPVVESAFEGPTPEPEKESVLPSVQIPTLKLRHWVGLVLALALGLSLFVLLIGNQILPLRVVTVTSGSMEPAIPAGSLMLLQEVTADQIRVGDVITFHPTNRPEQLDTHRVVAIETENGQERFVTQGDANPRPDAWFVPAEGQGWRYVKHVPYLGKVPEILRVLPAMAELVKLPVLALGLAFLIPLWLWPSREQTV